MKVQKKYTYLFIVIVALLGIYFILSDEIKKSIPSLVNREGFVSGQCPTTMIKDGEEIIVYNPKLAKIPGVNPLRMKSLKEYKEYIEWQRASGLDCPVLHLEKNMNAQGFETLDIKPSFDMDVAMGVMNHNLPVIHATPNGKSSNVGEYLDSTRDFPPFNNESYPSYDPDNQTIGLITEIDRM